MSKDASKDASTKDASTKDMTKNIYDVIIVGGGIAGIYCALQNKSKKVLLLESSHYWGGRIKTHYDTHYEPQYEIGAGRFHKNHKILLGLIKRFGLTPVPLDERMDYLDPEKGLIPHVEIYLRKIVDRMKLEDSMKLETFYAYCVRLLGKEEADHFANALGFHEIYYKNAYDLLKALQTDFIQGGYFVLKEGLSELCHRMVADCPGDCVLNHHVKSIERSGKYLKVDGIKTKKVVVTIPPCLFQAFPILDPYKSITQMITQGPLLRIYAKYPTFPITHTTTTELVSRHIIPIRDGIVMIAYVEDKDIHPFMEKGKLKTENEIKRLIHKDLDLPEPEWFKPYLWAIGTHAWLPGIRGDLPSVEGIHVCGEAFSSRQSWIEGALESCDSI